MSETKLDSHPVQTVMPAITMIIMFKITICFHDPSLTYRCYTGCGGVLQVAVCRGRCHTHSSHAAGGACRHPEQACVVTIDVIAITFTWPSCLRETPCMYKSTHGASFHLQHRKNLECCGKISIFVATMAEIDEDFGRSRSTRQGLTISSTQRFGAKTMAADESVWT